MKKNEEYSIGTGKKETGPETFQNRSLFENLMNQTNTNLKQSLIKMKKSLIKRQVLQGKVVWLEIKNLPKILWKKTNRDEPEKTKSEMDITLKNKTEFDKVESEKKFMKCSIIMIFFMNMMREEEMNLSLLT